MATTLIQEFHQGMRTHFGIQAPGQYIDNILAITTGRVHLDTIKFDEFLHGEQGDYEVEENISMADVLVKYYSQAAHDFVVKFL